MTIQAFAALPKDYQDELRPRSSRCRPCFAPPGQERPAMAVGLSQRNNRKPGLVQDAQRVSPA